MPLECQMPEFDSTPSGYDIPKTRLPRVGSLAIGPTPGLSDENPFRICGRLSRHGCPTFRILDELTQDANRGMIAIMGTAAISNSSTVSAVLPSGLDFGYDYACIIRFDFGAEALAQVQPKRSLTLQQLNTLLGGNRSWVTEMYKSSPSGDRVLLGVSTLPSGRTEHAAYWYNLTSNTLEEP
jgi:hypothetical protein